MNFTQITSRVLTRFQDQDENVYDTAEIQHYVNDAYMEVVGSRPDWPFLEGRRTQVTVAAGATVASLPTDVWHVTAVFNTTDGYALDPLDGRNQPRRHFPDSTAAGSPIYYRIIGSQIEVYPTPTAATVLELDTFAPPAELSDGADEPAFPRQHHRILVHGALALSYDDDGQHAAAAIHRTRFEQGIQRMAADLFAPRQEGYPSIPDTFFD